MNRRASEDEFENDCRVVLDAIDLVRRRAWLARGSRRLAIAAAVAAGTLACGAVTTRAIGSGDGFDASAAWGVALAFAACAFVAGVARAAVAGIESCEAAQVLDRLVDGRQECVAAEEQLRHGERNALVREVTRAAAARIGAAPTGRFAVRHPVEAWGVAALLGVATFAILGLPVREPADADRIVAGVSTSPVTGGGGGADRADADATPVTRSETSTSNAPSGGVDSSGDRPGDASRDPDASSDASSRPDRSAVEDRASETAADDATRSWMRSLGGVPGSDEELARLRRVRDAASAGAASAVSGESKPDDAVGSDAERSSHDAVDVGYPARYREVVARYFDPAR